MSQGGRPLDNRPEAIESQGVHGQSAERGHDLDAVCLALAVRVFPQLGVAGPMPGVFDAPAITHVLQQSLGSSTKTQDLATGLDDGLALSDPLA